MGKQIEYMKSVAKKKEYMKQPSKLRHKNRYGWKDQRNSRLIKSHIKLYFRE